MNGVQRAWTSVHGPTCMDGVDGGLVDGGKDGLPLGGARSASLVP